MNRHRVLWTLLAILIITSLACNAFAGNSPSPVGPPPTADIGEAATEASDMAPTATLPAVDQGQAIVRMLVDLNVRSGPGVQYDRVGFLLQDDEAVVIGQHEESGWWLIECPENVDGDQCWVSGGEQYTEVEDGARVVSVEAPPTPTPIPPEFDENTGIVAYADNGFLYALQLDLRQSPPSPLEEPVLLADSISIQNLAISPNGNRIAYTAGSSESNALFVVNVDGQDQRRLVVSEELPLSVEQNPANFAVVVDQIAWLPDGQTILFNTQFTNLVGAGSGSQEDLWSVTLDGLQQELRPAGDGGGAFLVTSREQILLSRANNIAKVNVDGSQEEIVLRFETINTASEYIYYPVPQMVLGDARVAIPGADPFLPDAETALWQIPGQGRAVQLGTLQGANLFAPVLWSPDGSRLAYVLQLFDPDAPQPEQLIITDGNGINPEIYAGGDLLQLHGWGDDNSSFIYSGNGFYTVGKIGAPPVQILLTPDSLLSDAQWMTETTFLTAAGQPQDEVWQLQSADVSGSQVPITETQGRMAMFDVWPHP